MLRDRQAAEDFNGIRRGEYLSAVGFDEISQSSGENIVGEFSFQFAIADEENDGMKTLLRQGKKLFESLGVAVILVERILKLWPKKRMTFAMRLILGVECPLPVLFCYRANRCSPNNKGFPLEKAVHPA